MCVVGMLVQRSDFFSFICTQFCKILDISTVDRYYRPSIKKNILLIQLLQP